MVCSPPPVVPGSGPEPGDFGAPMASKLHPPERRGGWLPRQRLTGRLASSGTKLVVVTAPAGFGKSIAVAQWRAAELGRRAFAWVTLDHGDDDPEGARAQRARLERLRRRLSAERGAPPAQTLTSRETAILNMLRGPLSVAGIAQELAVSPNTVKTHVRAIYRKLGVCTRPAALSRGRDLGLFLMPRRETW